MLEKVDWSSHHGRSAMACLPMEDKDCVAGMAVSSGRPATPNGMTATIQAGGKTSRLRQPAGGHVLMAPSPGVPPNVALPLLHVSQRHHCEALICETRHAAWRGRSCLTRPSPFLPLHGSGSPLPVTSPLAKWSHCTIVDNRPQISALLNRLPETEGRLLPQRETRQTAGNVPRLDRAYQPKPVAGRLSHSIGSVFWSAPPALPTVPPVKYVSQSSQYGQWREQSFALHRQGRGPMSGDRPWSNRFPAAPGRASPHFERARRSNDGHYKLGASPYEVGGKQVSREARAVSSDNSVRGRFWTMRAAQVSNGCRNNKTRCGGRREWGLATSCSRCVDRGRACLFMAPRNRWPGQAGNGEAYNATDLR